MKIYMKSDILKFTMYEDRTPRDIDYKIKEDEVIHGALILPCADIPLWIKNFENYEFKIYIHRHTREYYAIKFCSLSNYLVKKTLPNQDEIIFR